jgi:hypothetical protein
MKLALWLVLLPVIAAGCLGVGSGHAASGGSTNVEQAVLAHLRSTPDGAGTDSVTCSNDHQLRVAGRSALAVRCIPHGGHFDGIETCVIFEGDRLLNGNDLAGVPVGDLMCRGQA